MNMWMRWYAFLTSLVVLGGLPPSTAPAKRVPTQPATVQAAPAKPGGTTLSRDGAEITVQRTKTAGQAAPKLAAAAATSPMDFDRDGKDDPVLSGFFSDDYGVIVNYSGLPQRDYIKKPASSPGIPDVMTSGDFNGDGYADLVVGDSCEFPPSGSACGGGVWIFYGTADGLDLAQAQHFNQNTAGVPGDMEGDDFFGGALAAGDVNGDGRADLAIGAYGEKVNGHAYAGSVTILFGSSTGVTTTGAQLITQANLGRPSDAEPGDDFGWALAIGDTTGDGYDDLAISAPRESVGGGWDQSGLAMLLRGGPNGVTNTGVNTLLGDGLGLMLIGDSLSIADIDGDGDGDLVAGAPRSGMGYLVYVPGIPTGMDVPRARVASLDSPGVPGNSQPGSPDSMAETSFGWQVATGDVTGDGRADVLTGAIGYDIDGVVDAGAVFLIPGTAEGLTGAGSLMLTQRAPDTRMLRKPGLGVAFEQPEASDNFGVANAILNLDGAGPLDMLTATDEAPSGLIVWLGLEYSTPRRPLPGQQPTGPNPSRLIARKAGNAEAFNAWMIGYSLLHR